MGGFDNPYNVASSKGFPRLRQPGRGILQKKINQLGNHGGIAKGEKSLGNGVCVAGIIFPRCSSEVAGDFSQRLAKLLEVDRFNEIVVHAGVEALAFLFWVGVGGDR